MNLPQGVVYMPHPFVGRGIYSYAKIRESAHIDQCICKTSSHPPFLVRVSSEAFTNRQGTDKGSFLRICNQCFY